MHENTIILTDHAIKQFKWRFKKFEGGTLKKATSLAKHLLLRASEEKIKPEIRVTRLINNHFIPAKYFVKSSWRFVIVEERNLFIVVTIERRYKPRRKKRSHL